VSAITKALTSYREKGTVESEVGVVPWARRLTSYCEGGRKAERATERAVKGREGAPKVKKAAGRRTNVGRKAEPTDQFRAPRCGLWVMKVRAPGPSSARGSCQTLSDKRRTEGGTHRKISAPSLEIYWI